MTVEDARKELLELGEEAFVDLYVSLHKQVENMAHNTVVPPIHKLGDTIKHKNNTEMVVFGIIIRIGSGGQRTRYDCGTATIDEKDVKP